MANNLSVKIGANTSDLERSIERAKKTLEQYTRTARQAKSEIENNVSVSNQQVNAYNRVVRQLEKVNSGTLSTTQQQKVLTNQVKELKIQWNALTDDQRISGWGQQIADSLRAAESELETTKQKLEAVSDQTNKTSKGMDNVGKSSSKTGNVLGNLNGVLGKVGLAFGAAEVATTLFNGALKQSDEFGDLVTNKMAGLTNVVNSLGAALATLDFSGVMNFYSWFASGQASAQAHDTMDDTEQQLQYVYKQAQEAVTKAKETGSESDKAYANKKIQELNTLTKQYRIHAINAAAADLGKALKSNKLNGALSYEIIDAAIRATPQQQEKAKKTFKQQYAELQAKAISNSGESRWGPKSDALLQRYAKQGGLLNIMIGALWGTGGENRQQVIDDISKADDASRMASRLSKQLNGISDVKIPTVNAPKVSTTTPVAEQKTYLEQLEEQNKKIQQQTDYITKNYDKIVEKLKIQKAATKEYERQKELLEISATLDTSKIDTSQLKPVSLKDIIPKTEVPLEIKPVLNKKEMDKITKDAGDKEKKRLKEQADAEKEYANQVQKSISTVGNAFSTLGNAIGGTGGEIIGIMGQMIGQVPGIIQAIQSITAAKEGEAIASGTAEGAKAPWFMQVAVIAGLVANIVATFASIGKFANGGIIQGGSKIGDYNIARVNDGEMILNGSQQANLFKMLNSPIADQQQSTSIASTRLRGQDIYISLKTFLKENPSKKL